MTRIDFYHGKQQGVVLVLSLLILLILTIIGIAAMNSTVMQERMAGNVRTQTLAFEEAAGGVSRGLDFFYEHIDEIDTGNPWGIECGRTHGDGYDGFSETDGAAWVYPEDGSWDTVEANGMRLERRMYCCQNWVGITTDDGEDVCLENPSKLFVLNRGTFLGPQGNESLATREIEVALSEADPLDATCAICIPGEVGDVGAANSGRFQVDGACGAAIVTEDGAGNIVDAISDNNLGNYDGGIFDGDIDPPWNDPVALAEFVFWVKLNLSDADPGGDPDGSYHGYWEGNQSFNGNQEFGIQGDLEDTTDIGVPGITYVNGDLSMGGNVSGHGILIARGDISWNGTPDFHGLVISLGGDFDASGSGQGGAVGTFVPTNLQSSFPEDLLTRDVLNYAVAEDSDGMVMMDYEYFEEGRPVLRTTHLSPPGISVDLDRVILKEWAPDLEDLVFVNESGEELEFELDGNDIVFDVESDALPPIEQARLRYDPANPARDAFGRLIPDFLQVDNWPPYEYGYDPNLWGWESPLDEDAPNFPFSYGVTDLDWTGGGRGVYRYDCRLLQRVRHRLLCESPVDGIENLDEDVENYDYEDPDHASVCEHWDPAFEYNEDIEDVTSDLPNNFAWHAWSPRCDCLGVTADSDIVISAWRENLGWRDDDDFDACGLALSRSVRCDF